MTGMMAIDGIWWREMDPIGVMDWINHIRLYQCMVFQCSFRVANKQALTGDVGFSHWSHEKPMKRQQLWIMMLLLSFNDQPATKIGYCLRKSCTKRIHNYSWHRICLVTFHHLPPNKTISSWKTSWKPQCYHCSDDVPMIFFLFNEVFHPCSMFFVPVLLFFSILFPWFPRDFSMIYLLDSP